MDIKKLRRFDFMSPKVNLNVGGETGLKSVFGMLMTLFYIATVIGLSSVFIQALISTENPTVTQQTSTTSDTPYVSLGDNSILPILFGLQTFSNTLMTSTEMMRFVTPVFNIIKFTSLLHENGTKVVSNSAIPMPMIPCKSLSEEMYQQNYKLFENNAVFKEFGKENAFCLNFDAEEFKVGNYDEGSKHFIVVGALDLYPCTLGPGCASDAERQFVSFGMSTPTSALDYSNFEDPWTVTLDTETYYALNPSSYRQITLLLKGNEIYDERGFFNQRRLRKNFVSFDRNSFDSLQRNPLQTSCTFAEITSLVCRPYLTFIYKNTALVQVSIRSYKTITETLSRIGGINSFSLLIFLYINLLYVNCTKKSKLVGKVYEFLSEENQEIKKKVRKRGYSVISHGSHLSSSKNVPYHSQKSQKTFSDPSPHEINNMRDEAYRNILHSLDIVTIVKELNSLKVLTNLLLKEHQQKLVPQISLNLQKKRTQRKKKSSLKPTQKMTLKNRTNHLCDLAIKQMEETEDALQILRVNHKKRGKPTSELSLDEKIDEFCYQSLIGETEQPRRPQGNKESSKIQDNSSVKDSPSVGIQNNQEFMLPLNLRDPETQSLRSNNQPPDDDKTNIPSKTGAIFSRKKYSSKQSEEKSKQSDGFDFELPPKEESEKPFGKDSNAGVATSKNAVKPAKLRVIATKKPPEKSPGKEDRKLDYEEDRSKRNSVAESAQLSGYLNAHSNRGDSPKSSLPGSPGLQSQDPPDINHSSLLSEGGKTPKKSKIKLSRFKK